MVIESVPSTIFVGLLGAVVVALRFRKAGRGRDDRFSDRPDISLPKIYALHFSETDVSEERFMALWSELADTFEVPVGRMSPSDRLKVELSTAKGFSFSDPINDVMYTIKTSCERAGINPVEIESVRDYIIAFGSSRPGDRC